MDGKKRSTTQRTIDDEHLIQEATSSIPSESQQAQDTTTTNDFAARILVKGMKPLDQFTGAEEQDISVWLQDFEETVEAAGGDSATKRKAVVLYLSGDAKKWYRLADVQNDDWSTFRQKLITAFTSTSQQLKTMTKLMNRKQGMNELAQSYFYDILALYSKFNPSMNETEKLLHLLRGVKPSLAQNIIMFNPKTVQEFLELAKRSETTSIGTTALSTATTIEEPDVTAVMNGASDSEQVAAISRRRSQSSLRNPQISNNHFPHQNFSQYSSQSSPTTLPYSTDERSFYQPQQPNSSHQARTTSRGTIYSIGQQPTSHMNYNSRWNNNNGQPTVTSHREHANIFRNQCYNCGGMGHMARVCPSAPQHQQQHLNGYW